VMEFFNTICYLLSLVNEMTQRRMNRLRKCWFFMYKWQGYLKQDQK